VARRTLLITASILLAALGTALIWLYVQGAESRAQQSVSLVPALFFTKDVEAGQSPLGAVTPQQLPASAAAGAVTSLSEVGSLKLSVKAVAGQVLLKSMLTSSSASPGRFAQNGAISVTINDPNRVPADLQPGDTVDIFELSKNTAKVVLSDITVRTIGPAHVQAQTGTSAASGTTQNAGVSPSIVGLDIKDADTARLLYEVVARGDQIALYLHNSPGK
jgi:pilus assembly protein CpaB